MPQRKFQGEGYKNIDHKRLGHAILKVAEDTGFRDAQELFETIRNFEHNEVSKKDNFKNLGFWDFLKAFKKVETRLQKSEEPSLAEKSEEARKAPKTRLTGIGRGAPKKSGLGQPETSRDLTKVKKTQLKPKKPPGSVKRKALKAKLKKGNEMDS